ncbi:hypothetical protein DY000_02051201 [Brassica cretica]|uniref:Uncharacterized protein n=1 Tax=Brassica cretica TaxID=69181 RepID=A0ABQ7EUU3_BRACR|nr:hypothetical protein DY000_02051201 [Brassica cretica]
MGGRWRRKKKQELLVVGSEYRERRRSYWLWAKKIKSEEEIIRKRKDAETAELWRKGFDMGELRDHRDWGMHEFSGGKDCLLVVQLYAKRVRTYMPARYYITLLAAEEDPSATPASLVTFQTELYERKCCTLNLTCLIARLKGTKSTGNMGRHFRDDRDLPEWPDDKCSSRFLYEVMESEWEENDWIGLYLQVAIVTTDRRDYTYKPNLSGLKILNVVVETEENLPKETLLKCFPSVVVYISYDQDLGGDNGPNLSGLKILNVVVETEENLPKETLLKCFPSVVVYISYDQDLGGDNGTLSTKAGKPLVPLDPSKKPQKLPYERQNGAGLVKTLSMKTRRRTKLTKVLRNNGAEQIKPSERKKDDELVSKGSVKISKRPRKVVVGCLNKDEDNAEESECVMCHQCQRNDNGEEYRLLPPNHHSKEDKLQIKKMVVFAIDKALEDLDRNEKSLEAEEEKKARRTLLELKPKKAVAGKPVGRGRGRGGAGRGRVR